MAYNFSEATTDALHAGDVTTYDNPSALTLVGWQRMPTGALPNDEHWIIDKFATGPNRGFRFGYRPGGAGAYFSTHIFYIQTNLGAAGPSGVTQESNTWRHFAAKWDGTNAAMFKDGSSLTMDRSTYTGSVTSNATNLTIGNRDGGPEGGHDLAEVALWTRALSDDEIASLAVGVSPLFFNPTDYYPLLAPTNPDVSMGSAGNHADTTVNSPSYVDHPSKPFIYPGSPVFVVVPPNTGTTVALGQPTESNEALGLASITKTVQLGVAVETSSTVAVSITKTVPYGIASAKDSALPIIPDVVTPYRLSGGVETKSTRRYKALSGTNLISNGDLSGVTGWIPLGDCAYDATVSRSSDGTGSLKFGTAFSDDSSGYGQVLSPAISLPAAGWYTLSYYAKSSAPCVIGNQLKPAGGNITGPVAECSVDDEWQEVVVPFKLDPANDNNFRCQLFLAFSKEVSYVDLWIDEVRFVAGWPQRRERPSKFRPFKGHNASIDEFANWQVRDPVNGWEKFFPFFLHVDGGRSDWSPYQTQGWNANIWASTAAAVLKGANVGMKSLFKITDYLGTGESLYGNLSTFTTRWQEVIDDGLLDHIIGFYWDNEVSNTEWENWQTVIDHIRKTTEQAGVPVAPVYMLRGDYGAARALTSRRSTDGRPFVDTWGVYTIAIAGSAVQADDTGGSYSNGIKSIVEFTKQHRQSAPASIAQLNLSGYDAGTFRLTAYHAVIHGAKGIAYYIDSDGTSADIENEAWASDIPNLVQELGTDYIDLVRTPHYTTWAAPTTNTNVFVGTRHHNSKPHFIIANATTSTQNVTFDVSHVPYQIGGPVIDLSDGTTDTTVSSGAFTTSVPGIGINSGTKVLYLST